MANSLKMFDTEHEKRIHDGSAKGHLHKGHGVVAANASIPTNFQTIVTYNSDKKGFLSKAKRFGPVRLNENPAPCQYVNHGNFDKLSPSFSQRGSGGMAAKGKQRLKYTLSNAPGPSIYSLPSLLVTRNDFNRKAVTGVFAAPVAGHEAKTNGIPAPNMYNVMKTQTGRVNNVTACAGFKSKSKRVMMNAAQQSRLPAPDQYHIRDDLTSHRVQVPFSSFRSQSKRELLAKPSTFPGPGHYRPNEEVEPAHRVNFPRHHYLCISAPAMPLPATPPMPGPGSYETVDYEGPSKHYMSTSVFISTTARWTGAPSQDVSELPGPGSYQPTPLGKQSFIYNAAGRWL